jgi:hypothetical protein
MPSHGVGVSSWSGRTPANTEEPSVTARVMMARGSSGLPGAVSMEGGWVVVFVVM